jgi:hypothetical protein
MRSLPPTVREAHEQDRGYRLLVAIVFVGAVLLLLGFWVVSSYLEARSFERITGRHVSTWDAMFVELRVQEGARDGR